MLRLFVVVVALVAAPFAYAKPGDASPKAPRPSPSPDGARKGETVKAPKEALLAAADEITRQVGALRGLPAKNPLQRGVLSRSEIGQKLKERIAKEYTPEEVRNESRVLKRLGLLAPDADYEKLILDILMEQVAGFYDPFVGKLFIADWLPLEMQRPALAHEIQHALQDQHFDLKRFATPIKDDGDRQLARAALVEGDGTAVMLEFQAQAMGLPLDQLPDLIAQIGKQMLQGGMGNTPQFDKAPPFLKETLIFPYLGGLTFVAHLHRGAPWSKVDAVFKNPPESTEQVLHPEKYLAKELPVKIVPAPLPSLSALKELRRDVLGELAWKVLLASKLPEEVAQKAAAGWGGDRYVAFADAASNDSPVTIVNLSVWDTETDAKEVEAAGKKLLAAMAPPADKPDKSEWWLERKEDKILMVFGAPAGTQQALSAEAWKLWKTERPAPKQ
jgi:hypothetical protein